MATTPERLGLTNQSGEAEIVEVQRSTNGTVARPLLIWLTAGSVGSLLFTVTYLIEGATRPGYNPMQQAISALSLGPGGWVQQINFVLFGLLAIAMAFVWRQILKGGPGGFWYPVLRGVEGVALIVDGFFSQDPAGYPQGVTVTGSLHGTIHTLAAFVSITAIAVGYFVLAWRLVREPRWGIGWAVYAVLSGLLTMALIATFGTLTAQHSPIAGLFERLATSGVSIPFGIIVLVRLWLGVGFTTRKAKDKPVVQA
jgi:hypothetical protein